MEPTVVGQLGMEGSGQDSARPDEDGRTSMGRENLYIGPDRFHEWRPDEDCMEGLVERIDVEVCFETVDLSAVAITPDGNVDGAETALVGASIVHGASEKDHARTGAEDRHTVGESIGEWIPQT
jgi:hypothetical protein